MRKVLSAPLYWFGLQVMRFSVFLTRLARSIEKREIILDDCYHKLFRD